MMPDCTTTHTDAIYSIPINEDGSSLSLVQPQDCWRIQPAYYAQRIPGAIEVCYLRTEVITRLSQAATAIFKQTGWRMVILDGWRPPSVQKALYQTIFQQICQRYPQQSQAQLHQHTLEFVSLPSQNPLRPSPHLTGGSVDVSLCDANDKLLDMGSAFDEPTQRSYSDAYEHQPGDIRERRRLLFKAMTQAGFTNLPTEWWHFDYGNQNWAFYSGATQAKYGVAFPDTQNTPAEQS